MSHPQHSTKLSSKNETVTERSTTVRDRSIPSVITAAVLPAVVILATSYPVVGPQLIAVSACVFSGL